MKRNPGTRKTSHKLIVKAVRDYFGVSSDSEQKMVDVLEGKKMILTKEEESDVWAIKVNLTDKIYCSSF
jgi:hypothetical protein